MVISSTATNIRVYKNLVPYSSSRYNLGAIGTRWDNLYTQSVDATNINARSISTNSITFGNFITSVSQTTSTSSGFGGLTYNRDTFVTISNKNSSLSTTSDLAQIYSISFNVHTTVSQGAFGGNTIQPSLSIKYLGNNSVALEDQTVAYSLPNKSGTIALTSDIQTATDKFVPKTTQISTGDIQANIVNDNATLHIERVTPRSGAVSRIRWLDTGVEIYAKGTTGSDATYKFDYLGNLTKTIGGATDSYITIDLLENYLVATEEEVKTALGIS